MSARHANPGSHAPADLSVAVAWTTSSDPVAGPRAWLVSSR